MLRTVQLLLLALPTWSMVNNADLIWFDDDGKPQNYFARQPYPEGFNQTSKLVVNQKFPLLWEVKFEFFDNLEELVIDDCGVNDVLPGTFKDLQPLANLSLALNNIKAVKEGVFNFVRVKNLNLEHNRIQVVSPRAFDNMPHLERIVLDFNELRRWSGEWFFNCSRLATVSITHNFLEELPPKAFRNFWLGVEQVSFYFSYNKIDRIDREAFAGSGNFGDLFLDWNDVPRVDGHTFGKLTSVEHLNLNGDSLRRLSE